MILKKQSDTKEIYFTELPTPQKDLPFPLMKALASRRTKRKWKEDEVSLQNLSNLLWAGCGISFPETMRSKSRRTAPSGCNAQAVGIYVARSDGLFKYEEKPHALLKLSDEDIRHNLSNQTILKKMPLGLVYVSDYSKLPRFTGKNTDEKRFISGAEAGYISQNIYLYCAAANLSTTVIGLINREQLEKVMNLSECEKVIFSQAIGPAWD